MKRTEAAKFIEKVRRLEADWRTHEGTTPALAEHMVEDLQELLQEAGIPLLEECSGEAHSNAYIDNCSLCAPRWGWVGEKVKVT